jgi:hypothetical protein
MIGLTVVGPPAPTMDVVVAPDTVVVDPTTVVVVDEPGTTAVV